MKDKKEIKKKILKAIEKGGTQGQILKHVNWYDFKYVVSTEEKNKAREIHAETIKKVFHM